MVRVLVIGGYGNFGRFITEELAKDALLQVIIGGRNPDKGKMLANRLEAANPIESVRLDITQDLSGSLARIEPDIVVHTSGPFQGQGYGVARVCIEHGCQYIDLADAREYVCGFEALNVSAMAEGVVAIAGASSVPALTAAVIDEYLEEFKVLEEVDYGISAAQPTQDGLATVRAILNYVGKPFKTVRHGKSQQIFGWQHLRSRNFWLLGRRLLGNCDVPDLDLLPQRFSSLQTIRFQAGSESTWQHTGLFCLSWLVRLRLVKSLVPLAQTLLNISIRVSKYTSRDSGFYLEMTGIGLKGEPKSILFELTAHGSDGLRIPCVPAILLTKKLANKQIIARGAGACMGYLTLDEYLTGLSALDIQWRTVRLGMGIEDKTGG